MTKVRLTLIVSFLVFPALSGRTVLFAEERRGKTDVERFYSPHLEATVEADPGVMWRNKWRTDWKDASDRTSEADLHLLPFMKARRELFRGKRVLDIGTGMGILALYAAKLGASKVVATDIDPAAVRNARRNAERLGYGSVIETRLVGPDDPGAFAVVRPDEVFDVILSNVLVGIDRLPHPDDPESLEQVPPTVRLGFSILEGIPGHLAPDGGAILFYPLRYLHELMVRYARHLGYEVEHHPAVLVSKEDWSSLYNSFTAGVASKENIDPRALLYDRRESREVFPLPFATDEGKYVQRDQSYAPSLWGKKTERNYYGLILVRKGVPNKPPSAPR